MTAAQIKALDFLNIYTGGSFQISRLAGKCNSSCRVHIMSALHERRVSVSESGVNAIEKDFLKISGVNTNACRAVIEENFVIWAERNCRDVWIE